MPGDCSWVENTWISLQLGQIMYTQQFGDAHFYTGLTTGEGDQMPDLLYDAGCYYRKPFPTFLSVTLLFALSILSYPYSSYTHIFPNYFLYSVNSVFISLSQSVFLSATFLHSLSISTSLGTMSCTYEARSATWNPFKYWCNSLEAHTQTIVCNTPPRMPHPNWWIKTFLNHYFSCINYLI